MSKKQKIAIGIIFIITIIIGGFIWLNVHKKNKQDKLLNMRNIPGEINKDDKANEAKSDIENIFSVLNKNSNFKVYAVATHDRCYNGQNDRFAGGPWDGYLNRCSYKVTYFYGLSGDFKEQILNFEKILDNNSWNPIWNDGNTIHFSIDNWNDNKNSGDLGKYYRSDGGLEIYYAKKQEQDLDLFDCFQRVGCFVMDWRTTYNKENLQDIKSVFQKITSNNDFMLGVSIEETYFVIPHSPEKSTSYFIRNSEGGKSSEESIRYVLYGY